MSSVDAPTGALSTSSRPADTTVPLIDITIGALLTQRAAERPDALALVGTRHGTGERVRLTYAELLDEAARVATAIAASTRPGSYVALWAPNVVDWPIIEYGAALAGVVLVAINPALQRDELDYALTHSRSAVLIHADRAGDRDMAAVVAEVAGAHPDLVTISLGETDRWSAPAADPDVLAVAPTDPTTAAMLQYTSGTTGNPKGVLLSHRSMVNVAKLTMEAVEARPGAVAINPLPMFHTAACVIGTLGPLWLGGTEILVEKFAPGEVLEVARSADASILFYVPAILGALLAAQAASEAPAPHFEIVMGGASNVPATLIEAAESTFGASVINLFGQTELAPVLSATRPGDRREDQLHTVGRPLPQVDCKIVDPLTGEIRPIGVEGEICARGYQQLICYLHDPAATAATVDADGFVHTGDLGSMDERGYLKVTGRLKEIIIRGGENIAPVAVEQILLEHPAVESATVVGLPDERLGEIVAAVLVLTGSPATDLGAQLAEFAAERMARHQVPSRWFVTDTLPLTPTGKIRKFQVREAIADGRLTELEATR
ncbi:class I adenylate-forming enzyme family protein [Gordonia rubripertincta]|uniref:class I adenylate-forming enzyme family protein n=1 Tax=Gordonia rubripertincta TaxID=36822 RepID=UPI000B8D89B2|nr:class I adenylate-forming enzyme family protein [Gordonia rubripertincta]ASR01273.1 Long-chain-fatty-acid--CoA ligase [Gordonia rubripertincta]